MSKSWIDRLTKWRIKFQWVCRCWNSVWPLTVLADSMNIVSCPSLPMGLLMTTKIYPGAIVFFCIRLLKIIVNIRANIASRSESRWKSTEKHILVITRQLFYTLVRPLRKKSYLRRSGTFFPINGIIQLIFWSWRICTKMLT